MRSQKPLWTIAIAVACGGIFACTGGGGPLDDAMTTWDSARSTGERAKDTSEPAPRFREVAPPAEGPGGASAEPGPGAQGGSGAGAFDCSGTYSCFETNDDTPSTVTLTAANGGCSVADGDTVGLMLGSDGSLTIDGNTIGSWQKTSNGFTVTIEDQTVTCTKD